MGRTKTSVDAIAENRARQAIYKQKMKDAGCKPLTLWVHESKIDLLKATLQELNPTEDAPSPYKLGDTPTPALIIEHNRAICRENGKIQAYIGKFINQFDKLRVEKTLLDTVKADVTRLLLPLLGDGIKRKKPVADGSGKPRGRPRQELDEATLEHRRELRRARDKRYREAHGGSKPRGRPCKTPAAEPAPEPQAELELTNATPGQEAQTTEPPFITAAATPEATQVNDELLP